MEAMCLGDGIPENGFHSLALMLHIPIPSIKAQNLMATEDAGGLGMRQRRVIAAFPSPLCAVTG